MFKKTFVVSLVLISLLTVAVFAQDDAYSYYLKGYDAEQKHQYVQAMQWWKKAAALNNPTAMFYIGACYASGRGVDKNLDTAITWWKKAAALGNIDAAKALKTHGQ